MPAPSWGVPVYTLNGPGGRVAYLAQYPGAPRFQIWVNGGLTADKFAFSSSDRVSLNGAWGSDGTLMLMAGAAGRDWLGRPILGAPRLQRYTDQGHLVFDGFVADSSRRESWVPVPVDVVAGVLDLASRVGVLVDCSVPGSRVPTAVEWDRLDRDRAAVPWSAWRTLARYQRPVVVIAGVSLTAHPFAAHLAGQLPADTPIIGGAGGLLVRCDAYRPGATGSVNPLAHDTAHTLDATIPGQQSLSPEWQAAHATAGGWERLGYPAGYDRLPTETYAESFAAECNRRAGLQSRPVPAPALGFWGRAVIW